MRKQNTVTTRFPQWLFVTSIVGFLIPALASVSAAVRADDGSPRADAIKAAVAKSLPFLEKGAKGSMEQRKQCFTCHNQGLPIMALTTAHSRGFEIDAEHLQTQLKFTADFLGKNKQRYLEGKGQGGQVDTAGYALWTLDNGGWKPDETTAAVAEYFLLYQKDDEHWQSQSNRPPSEQSLFTSSYVALRGLKVFGTPEQKERIDARFEQVRQWLLKSSPQETEDRVFRLRAVQVVGASEGDVRRASAELLQTQRNDGGWAQLPDMESDAYATGTALVALHQAGGMSTDDPNYRKGLSYLISTQHDDGSWHVTSRSKPFQTYFESGYPHGKDQFISSAAAGWSTTALALALPKTTGEERIDFDRAKELFQKKRGGGKLTDDEEAYLQKAIKARNSSQAGGGGQVGVKSGEKIGLKPLTEMTADDRYKDEDGGLYGKGRNTPPESHRQAAEMELAKIQPLNADGKPAKDGKIVFVSISMSNATQEFSLFKQKADADSDKSSLVTIVDCAQGGQAMAEWVDPQGGPWREAERRIAAARVTDQQVQVAWVKLANKGPRGDLQEHGKKLQRDALVVLQNAKARFPNLRIVYLASRIYGGYAAGALNPEPYAYESAFACRWLIQDQIKGDAPLNYDAARGGVKAPLLLWGPYFWADGVTPRKDDQLVWKRDDLAGDGTHPSQIGGEKVARMLLDFYKTDPLARPWFAKHEKR